MVVVQSVCGVQQPASGGVAPWDQRGVAGVAWGSKTVLVLAGREEGEGGGGGRTSEGGEGGGVARQEWREDNQETFAIPD